jgi:osmotically-inducible protein OsmY
MKVAKALMCAAMIGLLSANAWSQPGAASAGGEASSSAPKQSNRTLRRAVYAAFAKDKSIDAGSIGVSAKNGAVTLTGTVEEASQIETAGTLAKGVPGVVSLQNKLTVKRPFN